jgi:hypothetical protein
MLPLPEDSPVLSKSPEPDRNRLECLNIFCKLHKKESSEVFCDAAQYMRLMCDPYMYRDECKKRVDVIPVLDGLANMFGYATAEEMVRLN